MPFFECLDETHDAIGVSHGRYLRGGDDQNLICPCNRVSKAAFDTGRRVDHYEIELTTEISAERNHVVGTDRILIPCLRRRQQEELRETLVFDQRLAQTAAPFDDVDQVVDD